MEDVPDARRVLRHKLRARLLYVSREYARFPASLTSCCSSRMSFLPQREEFRSRKWVSLGPPSLLDSDSWWLTSERLLQTSSLAISLRPEDCPKSMPSARLCAARIRYRRSMVVDLTTTSRRSNRRASCQDLGTTVGLCPDMPVSREVAATA